MKPKTFSQRIRTISLFVIAINKFLKYIYKAKENNVFHWNYSTVSFFKIHFLVLKDFLGSIKTEKNPFHTRKENEKNSSVSYILGSETYLSDIFLNSLQSKENINTQVFIFSFYVPVKGLKQNAKLFSFNKEYCYPFFSKIYLFLIQNNFEGLSFWHDSKINRCLKNSSLIAIYLK